MKMTVMGGGNIGTLMACEMAAKGHCVTVYTGQTEKWSEKLEVYTAEEQLVLSAKVECVTKDLEVAVTGADIIWVTYPAFMFQELAEKLVHVLEKGQMIGIVPGSGGVEEAFRELIEKEIVIFGFQRVHSIARIKEYGHSVYMLGRKKQLQIAAIPGTMTAKLCQICEELFEMECVLLPNYLTITLTPSNPILHTTRLFCMFREWKPGVLYDHNILFYEEWNDEASELLIKCDDELQQLCHVIPEDMSYVISLREHYESYSVSAMTEKISHIPAFKGIKSPMIQKGNGWIPDLQSRYFTADFPYGLKVIIDIAQKYHVPVPNMLRIWNWYEGLVNE